MVELPFPDPTLHPVGRNQSRVPGKMQLNLLRYCGLTPTSSLLEIGCGVGRLAYELANFIHGGRYVGFDIAENAIQWLNENYTPLLPEFAFRTVDAANARYRPRSGTSAGNVQFPVDNTAYDMVCAFSVFTHMRMDDIRRYLTETRRVLRPNGIAVLTFFAIGKHDTSLQLDRDRRFVKLEDDTWTIDLEVPERAIAFSGDAVCSAVENAGLVVTEFRSGYWRDSSLKQSLQPPFHKDVFVCTPAESTM